MVVNPLTQLLPATGGLVAAAMYLAAAGRLRGTRRPWPRIRTASFVAGVAAITGGIVVPAALGPAGHDPRVHMAGHLLAGMLGPLLIAVSGPVTLAFRSLGPGGRRRLAMLLGTPVVRAVGHPLVAMAVSAGGLWALYLTPLHAEMLHDPVAATAIQIHVAVAGTVSAWSIVGVDAIPRRPSLRVRGAALLAGLLLHTLLSRLLVADADRLAAEAGGTVAQWTTAAEIMWFEGDLLELALVVIFVTQAARQHRRGRAGGAPAARPAAAGMGEGL